MAEVNPMTPLIPSNGCTATFEDVLITPELRRRPPRARDYASENGVLAALAHEMAANPCHLLQTLVDRAADLCRAGTLLEAARRLPSAFSIPRGR